MDTQVADNAGIEPRVAPVVNVEAGDNNQLLSNPSATGSYHVAQLQPSLLPTYPAIGTAPQAHNPAVGTNHAPQHVYTPQAANGAIHSAQVTLLFADAYVGQFGAFAGFAQVRQGAGIQAVKRIKRLRMALAL